MKEDLKLTPDDTVVVKMDIEEAEWRVLPGEMSTAVASFPFIPYSRLLCSGGDGHRGGWVEGAAR